MGFCILLFYCNRSVTQQAKCWYIAAIAASLHKVKLLKSPAAIDCICSYTTNIRHIRPNVGTQHIQTVYNSKQIVQSIAAIAAIQLYKVKLMKKYCSYRLHLQLYNEHQAHQPKCWCIAAWSLQLQLEPHCTW